MKSPELRRPWLGVLLKKNVEKKNIITSQRLLMLMLTILEIITEANRQPHEWISNVKIKTESMQSKVVNRQTKTDSGRFCTILKNFTVNLFEHWGKCRLDVRWQLFSCLSCYLYSSGHAVFIKSWVNPVTMSLYTGSQWFEFCEYGVVRMLKQYLAFVFFGFELLISLLSPHCLLLLIN